MSRAELGVESPCHDGESDPAFVPRLVPHLSGGKIDVHGGWVSFLAVGEPTGGAYALIEMANHPSTGVPLHVHEPAYDTWFVLEGEFTRLAVRLSVRAGHYLFGPRGSPQLCQPDSGGGEGADYTDSRRL